MKIFEIGRALPEKKTGMIGLFEFQQAKALSDAGCEVHYIYFDSRSIKVNRDIQSVEKVIDGVHVHGLMVPLGGIPNPAFSVLKGRLYIKLLKGVVTVCGNPDVIHIHFPLLSITPQVWNFFKVLHSKRIVTEHWTRVQEKNLSKRQIVFLNTIYEEADHFICVSEMLKRSVQKLCGGDKMIEVIPNMTEACFSYSGLQLHEGFNFVAVGRLVSVKAFDLLIDAFTEAFMGDEDIKLTIIGGGKLYYSLMRQVSNLNMEKQIVLTGYKEPEEIAGIFKQSDCYVSASRLETFGVPFAEAWRVGIPCIAADNVPIKGYFTFDNGRLFKVDDKQSLSEELQKIIDEHAKYDAGRIAEKAEELFSGENIVRRLLEVFQA